MAHGNNTIPIPGELRSEATEGVVASADAVKDYRKNKFQEQVNLDVDSEISSIKGNMYTKAEGTALEENVNAAIERQDSSILSKFESQDERISTKFSQQDAAMASKFNQQDQVIDERLDDQDEKIDTILKQKVEVVDELPEEGEEGIIYRVPSTEGDGYADYMWQDGEFKLIGTFEFPGIDDEPTLDSVNVVRSAGIAAFYGVYEENPEWVYVMLDSQKHVLGGFKTDGSFEFSAGVPTPIREYVENRLNTIITDYIDNKVDKEDGKGLIIVDFADGVSYEENPEWVFVQLDAERKVLSGIRNDGTNFISRLEVGEFVDLDKLMAKFGNSYYNVSLNHTELESKVYYHSNSGWEQVEYDSSAYPYDEADTYNVGEICNVEGDTEHSYESTARQQGNYPAYTTVALHVTEKLDLAQALEKIPADILSGFVAGQVITFVDNDDIVERWELQNDETWSQINPLTINDVEERLSMELDRDDKILSYRKKDGTLVENAGIETNHLELTKQGMSDFQQALKDAGFNPEAPTKARQYHLPKYGRVNIKSETFYLTSDSRYSDKDGIYLIQDWEDTDENAKRDKDTGQIHEAGQPVSLCAYYIKSTLKDNGDGTYSKYNDGIDGHDVSLDFYAANKVTKVGSQYYVTDTLVEGQVVEASVEVTQIVDAPQYMAWPVEKSSEHYCIADIDFGHFMTKTNVPLGIKYQGQSTMYMRKRNFRITFYKKNDFKKKDKKKIGELVRLSGFNLKANWSDASRIKEAVMYRIFLDVWNKRIITDRFPWDKEFGYYTGATGFINGFPMRLEFGGDFYGLDTFALKKDERNYMLDGDDDHSGIFVCGSHRDATCWKHSYASHWEDEMMDEMSEETSTALYNFLRFISTMFEGSDGNPYRWHELTYFVGDTAYDYSKVGNKGDKIYLYPEYGEDEITGIYVTSSLVDGMPTEDSISAEFVGLNESEIEERMDIQGWMDYFICMQTFLMWDSICRNMILHTRSDKTKFYPYFYDLDLSLNHAYDADIFDIAYDTIGGHRRTNDMTLWENLKDIYWDQIVNRYCELRNTVLNTEYITALYHDFADDIPDADYANENTKWDKSTGRYVFEELLDKIDKRLAWLDENYFIV